MYEQIESNKRRSVILCCLLIGLIIALGHILGKFTQTGYVGIGIATVISIFVVLFSYLYSDRIILAISRARPLEKDEYPFLKNCVEGLAIAAGISKPKIYVIDDSSPNAFATGRNPEHSIIVVTTGLLEKLNRTELEGVIAHEISHIKNYDTLLGALTVVMVGTVVLLSDWLRRSYFWGSYGIAKKSQYKVKRGTILLLIVGLVLAIFSPLIAQLIRFAISRRREFLADADAALLTRYPQGLANALCKLAYDSEILEVANKATAHMYIVNPLKDIKGRFNSLFNTHPPIEERIAILEKM